MLTIPAEEADHINREEYFEHLIDNYRNLIYSICLQSAGNPFDAEDLTQDVFLAAYKSLSSFDGTHERAWLSKIAVHKCLDYRKQAARRMIPAEDSYFTGIADPEGSPEAQYLLAESSHKVQKLCGQLKSPYREIATEHFCHELSPKEIADKTGKNLKTIQTQLYRAKGMLKKLVERSG